MPKKENEPLFVGEQPPVAQSDAEQARSDASGGVEVEILRDYWPAEQPEPEQDPKKPHRENRLRAGERHTVSTDEAFSLIESGAAKRVRP